MTSLTTYKTISASVNKNKPLIKNHQHQRETSRIAIITLFSQSSGDLPISPVCVCDVVWRVCGVLTSPVHGCWPLAGAEGWPDGPPVSRQHRTGPSDWCEPYRERSEASQTDWHGSSDWTGNTTPSASTGGHTGIFYFLKQVRTTNLDVET